MGKNRVPVLYQKQKFVLSHDTFSHYKQFQELEKINKHTYF